MQNILFVEPFKSSPSSTSFLVGIGTLPVLKVERRFREVIKRVLDFRLRRNEILILLLISFFSFGFLLSLRSGGGNSRLRFLLLLLLGRRGELDSFLDVCSLAEDGFQLWLVGNSLQVAHEVGNWARRAASKVEVEAF